MNARSTNSPQGASREVTSGSGGGSLPNSFSPGQLIKDVEDGAGRLETAAEMLHEAIERYEVAEAAYEKAVQTQLIAIYHKAKEAGERLPAEDIRRALAHQEISNEIYAEFLTTKATKEALQTRYRALSAAVSARQSLLKALGGV